MLTLSAATLASNPFTSNVQSLTPSNWSMLEQSPHLWMVNVCRQSWGFCALLTPEWEQLAGKLKNQVKIAYWDTEQGANPPRALGEIKGTPTIKAFVPKRSSPTNKKEVVEYQQERKVRDLLRFATSTMPSYVEALADAAALAAFDAKAAEWGLPRILVFSKSSGTSSLLKALSGEYRRRVLIGEIKMTTKTAAIVEKYEVKEAPTLIGLRAAGGEPLRFEKKEPTYFRLDTFFGKVALKKPVLKKPAAKDEV